MKRHVWFLLVPEVHLLDLSGPVQTFFEAHEMGADYELHFTSAHDEVCSAQGLRLSQTEPLPETVGENDLILVAGMESSTMHLQDDLPLPWLRKMAATGATICSVCTGAFVLARAGLLDGRRCTTHWKMIERLRREHPAATVLDNRLFVSEDNIVTSAGIVSGIDTALWLVERDFGPILAARTARELVVWLRRDGNHTTDSIYLDYRTHLHPGVHKVQDWLISHPDRSARLDELARIAAMSPRNLTRVFRQATGVTLKDFSTRIKLDLAGTLLHNPGLTVERIASDCGFRDARQLRRLWKQHHGQTPSEWKHDARRQLA